MERGPGAWRGNKFCVCSNVTYAQDKRLGMKGCQGEIINTGGAPFHARTSSWVGLDDDLFQWCS